MKTSLIINKNQNKNQIVKQIKLKISFIRRCFFLSHFQLFDWLFFNFSHANFSPANSIFWWYHNIFLSWNFQKPTRAIQLLLMIKLKYLKQIFDHFSTQNPLTAHKPRDQLTTQATFLSSTHSRATHTSIKSHVQRADIETRHFRRARQQFSSKLTMFFLTDDGDGTGHECLVRRHPCQWRCG